jgi:hypothetical protein
MKCYVPNPKRHVDRGKNIGNPEAARFVMRSWTFVIQIRARRGFANID